MDQKYSSKLYSKRKANDYLSRFCVRISSRSLAKQSAGTSGDHGSSFLRLSRLLFGLTDGITDNNQFRYLPGLRPLTLAVCTMESQPALTSAPTSVKLNREFFLQITKGRIEFSTVYANIRINCQKKCANKMKIIETNKMTNLSAI